jgi:predicted RNA-binding Zn-ribbon protein involved in translation (DUF1610 family)
MAVTEPTPQDIADELQRESDDHAWVCPACGCRNGGHEWACFRCGEGAPEEELA